MAETLTTKKAAAPLTGGATVSVASKMPFDFTLRLYDFVKKYEPVLGGGSREIQQAVLRHGVNEIVIKGNSYNRILGDNGKQISGGYSITHGIPKSFMDEWLDQNSDLECVKAGLLFAHSEVASLHAETTEKAALKSGMERLDRDNLPKNQAPSRTRT